MRTLTTMTPTKFHLFLRLVSINQDSEQGSVRYETKNSPAQNLVPKKLVGIQVLFHLRAGRFVLRQQFTVVKIRYPKVRPSVK